MMWAIQAAIMMARTVRTQSRLARQCDVPHNGFTEEAITFLRECLNFSFHSTKSVIIFSEENSHG
jgi:hypothetical protein